LFTFASELAVVVVALDSGSADFAATLTHDSGQRRSDDLVAGRVDDRVEDAAEVWKQRQSGVEAVRATGARRRLHNHSAISCRVPTLTTCHCPRLLSRAVLRRGCCRPPAVQQSIDISWLPGLQQQTCSNDVRRPNGTDGQTGGRTADSCIHPAAHTMRTVLIISKQISYVFIIPKVKSSSITDSIIHSRIEIKGHTHTDMKNNNSTTIVKIIILAWHVNHMHTDENLKDRA